MKLNRSKKGFTLIELMIVVAIIGILAAVAVPKFADLVTKSKEASSKGVLGAIRSAISIYYGDTEGTYPTNVFDGLTSNSRYLPATGGGQNLGSINLPKVKQFTDGCPGHVYPVVTSNQVEQGNGTNPNDAMAFHYVNGTNREGEIFIACSHKDTKNLAWSGY